MPVINIISPHLDDAVLSLGGCILKWRTQETTINIFNVFTISNWVTPGANSNNLGHSVEDITEARKKEELIVGNLTGCNIQFWDFDDLPLRSSYAEKDKIAMVNSIARRLRGIINREDVFFFPLGIDHSDHILVRELSRDFLQKGYNICYYEDMPYFGYGNIDYQSFFVENCRFMKPYHERIDLPEKLTILRNYRSQILESWLRSIKTYSYNVTDNSYYERYWSTFY